MALNIPAGWESRAEVWSEAAKLQRARREGWEIHAIARMEDLLEFARAFARRHYDVTASAAELSA
jgi:hypothetical protein